jgi:hypothetical protein
VGRMSIWNVETSHMVAVPKSFMVDDIEELKRVVQATADTKKRRPIVGPLEYTHMIRDGKEYLLAHFRHHETQKKMRFMRLVRSD